MIIIIIPHPCPLGKDTYATGQRLALVTWGCRFFSFRKRCALLQIQQPCWDVPDNRKLNITFVAGIAKRVHVCHTFLCSPCNSLLCLEKEVLSSPGGGSSSLSFLQDFASGLLPFLPPLNANSTLMSSTMLVAFFVLRNSRKRSCNDLTIWPWMN